MLQRSPSLLYVPLYNNIHLLLLLVEVQCVLCEVRAIFLCITVSTDFCLQAAIVWFSCSLRYFTFITVKSLALEWKEIKLKFQITHFSINENFKAVCCRLLPTPFWRHHPRSRFQITPSRRAAGETWEPFSPVTLFVSQPPYTSVSYSCLPLWFVIHSSIFVFRWLLWFSQKSVCLLRTTLCVFVWMYVRAE